MENLMEKIRAKAVENPQRTLIDTSKTVRISMADRKHSLDTVDKGILRACLDLLQTSIEVKSAAGMSERLETAARQLGLKFMVHSSSSNTNNFYISTETFYVEICIDKHGIVLETRIHHQNQSSITSTPNVIPAPELTDCLARGDFSAFMDHLKGLISVYDLPDCGNMDKTRAWQALNILEHDLMLLASGQSWVTDINQLIHKTGLGMVHNRAGGVHMKLRYFLPPYELLDMKNKTILPMNQETITKQNLGMCVTIALKSSKEQYLLPMSSLISSTGQDLPITTQNALNINAHFALVLDKPLPMSKALARQVVNETKIDWLDDSKDSPLLALIVKQNSNGQLDPSSNRGLFVTLPDQQHCYFLTESEDLMGQLIEYIPFRHPNQVATIIDLLRRQALFNTLVASCVRANSLEDVDTSTMFEVTCLDPTCQNLSVSFEHPSEETMATAELSLSDLVAPRCLVYTGCMTVCPEETANRVLQRSLSIPITMRAVLTKVKRKMKQTTRDGSDVKVENMSYEYGQNIDSVSSKNKSDTMSLYKLDGVNTKNSGEGDAENRISSSKRSPHDFDMDSKSTSFNTFRHPSFLGRKDQLNEERNLKSPISGRSVKPNVSITPISHSNTTETDSPGTNFSSSAGIEIIPLGGGPLKTSSGGSGSGKSKSSLKRSYSEDDKSRIQPSKKDDKRYDYGRPSKNDQFTTKTENQNLAGVIERLVKKSKDDCLTETRPSPSHSLELIQGGLNDDDNWKKENKKKFDPKVKPKLKLMIKPPTQKMSDGSDSEKKKYSQEGKPESSNVMNTMGDHF